MKKVISIVLILLFLSGILHPLESHEVKKPKSEKTAMFWSLGGTIVPQLTFYGAPIGITVGPSFGHIYAGQHGRALLTTGIRTGAWLLYGYNTDKDKNAALMWTGLITILATTLYDIITAPSSVRKYNESIKKTGNVYFVPKIDINEEHYGLSVVYNF